MEIKRKGRNACKIHIFQSAVLYVKSKESLSFYRWKNMLSNNFWSYLWSFINKLFQHGWLTFQFFERSKCEDSY